VNAKTRLFLRMGVGSALAGMVGVILVLVLTWPQNSLGAYFRLRDDQGKIIRALERRIAGESNPLEQAFYQAWLTEEQGDQAGAIAGFREVQDRADRGGSLYVRATLRLGQSYGRNGEFERELAAYQSLMARHPGASRLGQILFHLRHDERVEALAMLEIALAQDGQDGSLGQYRQTAREIRDGLRAPGTR
jgi:hypothetical protein